MRGRPFEVAWREPDTPEALKGAYQREPDPQVRTRLHGLWLLRCGWRLGRVAEVMGTHYRSVQCWVAWYREGGLPEVRRHQMGGRGPQPWLRPEAEIQGSDAVATGGFRTAWEIRDWIAQQYGASYTLGGVYSLLKRLKCAPKVPRPVHAKADRQLQAAWKKGSAAGPGRSGSQSGNRLRLCRRDAGGTAGHGALGLGWPWGEGAPTAPVGLLLALPLSGGQGPGGQAALVLAGFHGWGANGGGSGWAPEAHGGSYRGLGGSAGPLGRMGKGVGEAANRVATVQSGTQSSGTGVSGGAAGY